MSSSRPAGHNALTGTQLCSSWRAEALGETEAFVKNNRLQSCPGIDFDAIPWSRTLLKEPGMLWRLDKITNNYI